jgi:antitoxin component YwqK of YwqJK toxin-antitoxin module
MKFVFIRLIQLLLVGMIFPATMQAQLFNCKSNQWENNLREGYWIEYSDTTNKIPMNSGKYHLGIQTGRWKYYFDDGTVRKKERIGNKYIVTKYYHPNGKIKSKGKAIVDRTDPVYLHYYYEGAWMYYDENGKPEYRIVYSRGEQVGEKEVLR